MDIIGGHINVDEAVVISPPFSLSKS